MPLAVRDVVLYPASPQDSHGRQEVYHAGEHIFTISGPEADVLEAALAGYNAGYAHGSAEGREAVKASFRQLLGL